MKSLNQFLTERSFTFIGKKKSEKKAEKAMDAGAKARRLMKRREHAKYVSGSEDNVPDDIREGDVHSGQGEKIQSRTLAWMKKRGEKGAPGLNAMKARTAEHKAKRGVKEEVIDENRMAAYTAGAGEGSPASRPTVSQKTADMVGRRSDKDAFGDRKKKQGIRLSPTKKYSGKDKGKVVKRANTTGRGTPTQYRKSHEDPDMGRYQQKVTQGRSSVKDLRKEDKAFDYVVAKLKKQHGDGVLTKGDKIKPPSAAQKKKNAAIMAQRAKQDGRDATEKASSGRYNDRSRSD